MDRRIIKRGMEALIQVDGDLARAVEEIGLPAPRLRPAGFGTLFAIILSQQISTGAARAIHKRVTTLLEDTTPESLLAVSPEALRSAGMSYRKIEYARGLAESIVDGRLDLDGLRKLENSEIISAITALRGFGVWSAEIYLMFSLRRRDVFPADDLALRSSLQILKGLDARLTSKQARNLVEHWSPWRSVGALFLWHYYQGAPT